MEDRLVRAVTVIAKTLTKLEEEGVFTLAPAQVNEGLSTLNRIANILEKIESRLESIDNALRHPSAK